MIDWEKVRIDYAGQIAQGMLERSSSWTSKLADDILYKKIAKHSVALADALIEGLQKDKETKE